MGFWTKRTRIGQIRLDIIVLESSIEEEKKKIKWLDKKLTKLVNEDTSTNKKSVEGQQVTVQVHNSSEKLL